MSVSVVPGDPRDPQAASLLQASHALMQRLEAEARAAGFAALKLETGNTLHAAHRLYARHGFAPCDRFGDYPGSPSSLFMEKPLA